MDGLCSTADTLSKLSEMRTCILSWKTFTLLLQNHYSHLITRLDANNAVEALLREIQDGLKMFGELHIENKVMVKTEEHMYLFTWKPGIQFK